MMTDNNNVQILIKYNNKTVFANNCPATQGPYVHDLYSGRYVSSLFNYFVFACLAERNE